MLLFKWSKEYSVGVTVMDDHHKQLFNIINTLYDMDAVVLKTNIIPLLEQLISYTEFHFGEEERLLERANYSGLSLQRIAHREFVNKLKVYKEKVRSNPEMSVFVANEVSMTASDWLKGHILRMDKGYENSLRMVKPM